MILIIMLCWSLRAALPRDTRVVNKREVCIMAFQLQLSQRFSCLARKTLLDFLTEAAGFNELSCSRLSAVLAHVGMLFM